MGLFIVFEGPDNGGKSTAARATGERLVADQIRVYLDSNPTKETPIGSLIRASLAEDADTDYKFNKFTRALLFAADRTQRIDLWKEMLADDRVVIVDRYVDSALVYQTAEEIPRGWNEQINERALHFPPDIVFVLYADVDTLIARGLAAGKTPEIYDDREKIQKHLNLYKIMPSAFRRDKTKYYLLDTTHLNQNQVVAYCLAIVRAEWKSRHGK
jgi:dTMP kinase